MTVICIGSYGLGSYRNASPPLIEGLFHRDYTAQTTPNLRTVAIFYFSFDIVLCITLIPMTMCGSGGYTLHFITECISKNDWAVIGFFVSDP